MEMLFLQLLLGLNSIFDFFFFSQELFFKIRTWKSKPNEVKEAIKHAFKVGYRHIDGAFVYKNEQEVGEGLAESMTKYNLKRKDVFITTKLWNTFHRKEHIEEACLLSLKDLKLDYLDCYLMHWPIAFKLQNDWLNTHPTNNGKTIFDNVPLSGKISFFFFSFGLIF